MEYCPDAPYIQEAEMNGMPSPEPVTCPFCGKSCETIYVDKDGDSFACDRCVRTVESWFWDEMNKEDGNE